MRGQFVACAYLGFSSEPLLLRSFSGDTSGIALRRFSPRNTLLDEVNNNENCGQATRDHFDLGFSAVLGPDGYRLSLQVWETVYYV